MADKLISETLKNSAILNQVKGFSLLMNNSKNYWDKTLTEVEQNFCNCDCLMQNENEEEEKININKEVDNLITDKRKINEDSRLEIYEMDDVKRESKGDTFNLISNQNNYISTGDSEKQLKIKNLTNNELIDREEDSLLIESKKVWTKEEDEILLDFIKNSKIKNWKKISKILKTKTPQQCSYRFKKIYVEKDLKKWTRNEDILLVEMVEKFEDNWDEIKRHFPYRKKEEIKERYYKKLDPNLNSKFDIEEDNLILKLHSIHGNKWTEIAKSFKDKSATMLKNRYYSTLKKSDLNDTKNQISLSEYSESERRNSISNSFNQNSNYSNLIMMNNLQINSINNMSNEDTITINYSVESESNFNGRLNNSTKTLNKINDNSFNINQDEYFTQNKRHTVMNNKRDLNNWKFTDDFSYSQDNQYGIKDDKSISSNVFSSLPENNYNQNKIKYNNNLLFSDDISLTQFSSMNKNTNNWLWDDNSAIDQSVFENNFDFEEFIQDFDKIEKELNTENLHSKSLNNKKIQSDDKMFFSYQNYSDMNNNQIENYDINDIFNIENVNKSHKSDGINSNKLSHNSSLYTNSDIIINNDHNTYNELLNKNRKYSNNSMSGIFDSNTQSGSNKKSLSNNDLYQIPNNDSYDYLRKEDSKESIKMNIDKNDNFQENYNKVFNPELDQSAYRRTNTNDSENMNMKIDDSNKNFTLSKEENKKEEEMKKINNQEDISEYDIILLKKYKILENIYLKYKGFKLKKFILKKKINEDKKKGKSKSDQENIFYLTKENDYNKEMDLLTKNLLTMKKEYNKEMKINNKSQLIINNMRNLLISQTDILMKLTSNMKMKIDLIRKYEGTE